MWILAIDIGGTAIKCGLVNSQGERRQLTQFHATHMSTHRCILCCNI